MKREMKQMKEAAGLTIIQVMVLLLVAGIVGMFAVDALIDMRCESDPAAALCKDRTQAGGSTAR